MSRHPSLERILVTNDDGIHAPGLETAEKIARELSDDVWIVAPEFEQSGAGHSLSLTEPLRLRRLDERRFAVRGTPTDAVMLAMNHLMGDARPTLVLSGVNRGVNLGEDITYSGTVAGAIEGTIAGVPSIALSQAYASRERKVSFASAEQHAPDIIRHLVEIDWPDEVLMNVNFPPAEETVKGIRATRQGRRDLSDLFVDKRKDPRGFSYYWFGLSRTMDSGDAQSDLTAIQDGWISVTPLHINLTHEAMVEKLAQALKD